ncbi:hypothetical protein LPUS_05208 [Lasallia pustulata]|uniref:F-box domain-containing protein n=1 Tax=Lasallia pustulata TaxID=136370 RepID=A0A1W5CYM4_9LECA|nr:hypothetical protein LPUS_05208 [Lasallia pustulata]
MQFEDLATELVLHIFQSCTSIPDVLNLASTCHHFRKVFAASQRLPILYRAAEAQFGPLQDAIQLVTHNASQPAHLMRSAPSSSALLHQLLEVGRVAQKWEAIYPLTKWKHDFTSRRLLTAPERRLLRRAIYRLWLYSRAFHTPAYPRTARKRRANVLERAALLHNWSSPELAQIEDVRLVIRHVLQHHVCPSNGALRRSFRNRFPDDPQQQQLLFQGHRSCPPPPSAFREHFHSALQVPAAPGFVAAEKFRAAALQELGAEGWFG